MLYLSLFCLNLSYESLDVYNSGGGVVPNSDVYKYSDPIKPGSQSTSPSLIILGQSIVYAEVVAKQTGPNRRNNRFSLHLMSA